MTSPTLPPYLADRWNPTLARLVEAGLSRTHPDAFIVEAPRTYTEALDGLHDPLLSAIVAGMCEYTHGESDPATIKAQVEEMLCDLMDSVIEFVAGVCDCPAEEAQDDEREEMSA